MKDLLEVKFEQFIEDFNLQGELEDACWKRFVNYQFFSQIQPGRLDTDLELLEQICVNSSEFSHIHGALFLLNDQIICEPQDIDDILQRDQKALLELYFLTFDEFDDFNQQLANLFQNLEIMEKDQKWIKILAYAMSQKIMLRWKDNPVLHIVCYENKNGDKKICDELTPYFSKISSIGIDRKGLLDIIKFNENNYRIELDIPSFFPVSAGKQKIANAFIGCISASELIKLMVTSEGMLRRNIFDDNVRDSQGFSAVNHEIYTTLKQSPSKFVLFNNGITIVCKKATLENGKYVLETPQIVNGCQTCNMIYQAYREKIDLSEVQVIAKIVGSNEEDVTQGIVRGANRQNIVYEEAFETIKGFHKDLEKYFEVNQVSGYDKIYYERRSRQYADNIQIKPRQKINFRGLIQSMVALFLNHVEDSHRHEYTLLKKYKDMLFIEVHECIPYYLAAFLYLNVDILFREKKLPKHLSGYKMHIMLLIKEMEGGASPDLSSNDIGEYCSRLLQKLEFGKLEQYALAACEKFEEIRKKWIDLKGEQYQYGVKDSADFKNFLMLQIRGNSYENDVKRIYTGYVMNIDMDKHNTLYGFIEHVPDNIFFHEFDNPDIDRSYIGKKVSYKIVRNAGKERAINVKLI